jgi:ABC-2 type transport system permease protein
MRLLVRHTFALTVRQLLALWRQPWFVAITLVQPMIWLLLFGALFKRVVEIPGFHGGSYIDFLAPGIVVMSALFSAGWHGMSWINAIDRGIMDRFLVSPVSRFALIASGVAQQVVIILIQSLIIVGVAAALGAKLTWLGVAIMLLVASLLGAAVCALSDGLALVARQEETVIGVVQFVVLPATFLSSGLMAANLLPGWIHAVARFNPVNWSVVAARAGISSATDWSTVGLRVGLLAALVLGCIAVAQRAVGVYQRSV